MICKGKQKRLRHALMHLGEELAIVATKSRCMIILRRIGVREQLSGVMNG